MSRKTISYDIKLVKSFYKSDNDALIRLAEKTLVNNKNEFDAYIKKSINSIDTHLDSILISELSNIDWIFLNSIYLTLYTNFENLVYEIARIVEERKESAIGIEDIKGYGYVDQYRKYMHLVGGIKSAQKDCNWDELDIYRLVRNKLTHEDGFLNKNLKCNIQEKKEFQYLIKNKVLLAGTFGHIRIREIFFLNKFCTLTNKLLDSLVSDIESLN
jgi:hypothetical protein